jgi:hypothetical protein
MFRRRKIEGLTSEKPAPVSPSPSTPPQPAPTLDNAGSIGRSLQGSELDGTRTNGESFFLVSSSMGRLQVSPVARLTQRSNHEYEIILGSESESYYLERNGYREEVEMNHATMHYIGGAPERAVVGSLRSRAHLTLHVFGALGTAMLRRFLGLS